MELTDMTYDELVKNAFWLIKSSLTRHIQMKLFLKNNIFYKEPVKSLKLEPLDFDFKTN